MKGPMLVDWTDQRVVQAFGRRIVRAPGTISPPAIDRARAAGLFAQAWLVINEPDHWQQRHAWARWARMVGFVDRGVPGEAPTSPLTLFRAAPESHRLGMSWAPSLGEALPYLTRHGAPAPVWVATVPAGGVLARLDDPYGQNTIRTNPLFRALGLASTGTEYVVDPDALADVRRADVGDLTAPVAVPAPVSGAMDGPMVMQGHAPGCSKPRALTTRAHQADLMRHVCPECGALTITKGAADVHAC